MTYKSKYGARDGLADRLEDWVRRLGTDRSLPWAGTGLLADLQTAADVLKGKAEIKQAEYDL